MMCYWFDAGRSHGAANINDVPNHKEWPLRMMYRAGNLVGRVIGDRK